MLSPHLLKNSENKGAGLGGNTETFWVFVLPILAGDRPFLHRHVFRNAEVLEEGGDTCMHLFHLFDVLLLGFEVSLYLVAPFEAWKLVEIDKIPDWQPSM